MWHSRRSRTGRLCVNDGSPDGSAAILAEYASRDSRFKIVTKENGGLSDARNVGMEHSTGEYVMYLDSDDLIHPQTMEIALALARRDGSDVVSWYKNKLFHIYIRVRGALGLELHSALPIDMHRKYSLSGINSYVTDDIFNHVTEVSNSPIKHPIKHFYVWRHLMKRELIKDIPFTKGLIYEDFPLVERGDTQVPSYYDYKSSILLLLPQCQLYRSQQWLYKEDEELA